MIIISPYSRALRNGKRNPKNFPYWKEVLQNLKQYDIIQIGTTGEDKLVGDFRKGLPYNEIKNLIKQCDVWMSVDNFLPHLAHHVGKPGVVVWGISDPIVFGYPENINVLKDRSYLRKNQFDMWDNYPFDPNVFPSVDEVVKSIQSLIRTNNK